MPEPIALGPFELVEICGAGGMSQVWRATCGADHSPVAVKIMTARLLHKPAFQLAFNAEVRAAARLEHPGIIRVLDFGLVDYETATESDGVLVAGSPYFAMEYASLGSLGERPPISSYHALEQVLLSLLDALAHAHARGVVHRDLKPGNVLVTREPRGRERVKISDFGIARVLEEDEGGALDRQFIGTPHYMAPEQITNRWRDQGPWTDLYALGCLAYTLASGRPPFGGKRKPAHEVITSHLHANLPPLQAKFPVPEGLQKWLDLLLRKEPIKRFRRAADAAFALRALSSQRLVTAPGGVPAVPGVDAKTLVSDGSVELTSMLDFCPTLTSTLTEVESVLEAQPHYADDAPSEASSWAPPFPAKMPATPPHSRASLAGVGLGLLGLRRVPWVNRVEETQRLWTHLSTVHTSGRARVIVLQGPSGIGKSRLAETLCERAHEVGGGIVFKASHDPQAGRGGISEMLSRWLHCEGLSRDGVLARVIELLERFELRDADQALAITELIRPNLDGDSDAPGRRVRLGSERERFLVALEVMRILSKLRPVILWIEDVQWAFEALVFANALMDEQARSPLRALLVLTVRGDLLASRGPERERLESLLEHPGTELLDLRPLDARDLETLCGEVLPLAPSLATTLSTAAKGNPLYAIQLVEHWFDQHLLVSTEEGYLSSDTEPLPEDLIALGLQRVSLVTTGDSRRLEALELAAALGLFVDRLEWAAVCEAASVSLSESALQRLFNRGLLQEEEAGWRFGSSLLRESLERSAREADRWARHHRCCADTLSRLHSVSDPLIVERLANHKALSGDLEAAIEDLARAAELYFGRANLIVILALMDQRDRFLSQAGVAKDDARWGVGWCLRARALTMLWRFEESTTWAKLALEAAESYGAPWHDVRLEALLRHAATARQLGDTETAKEAFKQALDLAKTSGNLNCQQFALYGLGVVATQMGDFKRAATLQQDSAGLTKLTGNRKDEAAAIYQLAGVSAQLGDLDGAARHIARARALFAAEGDRLGLAMCENGRAELARQANDFETAEQGYRRALALFQAVGSGEVIVAKLNLALVSIQIGRFVHADVLLDEVERTALGNKFDASLLLARLATSAAALDWARFDRTLDEVERAVTTQLLVGRDLALCAEIAAGLAKNAGEPGRARVVYLIAESHWQKLGDADRAAQMRAALEELDGPC